MIGAAAAGLAGLASRTSADPSEPGPSATPAASGNAGVYRTRVGALDVALITDGWFNFDPIHPTLGGNVDAEHFAAVSREFHMPEDGYAQIHALLVRSGDRVVLIDAGSGNTFAPTCGRLIAHLASLGVQPGDVTDILVTHAHLDHVGGFVDPESGRFAFPNAAVHLADAERDFWRSNPSLDRSGVPDAMKPMIIGVAVAALDAAGDRQQTVRPGREVLPGITAVDAAGHTPGHTAYLIADGDESLMFLGDLIFFAPVLPMNPDWHVGFDTDPAAAAATRFRMMDRVATDRTRICASHLPFPALGHLKARGSGYEFLPERWRFDV